MKICNICKIEKEFKEFHKHRLQKDGYNTICKECRKPITKKYINENKEKIYENRTKKYYENHEENLIKGRTKTEEQRVKHLERSKKYVEKNREKVKKYQKNYYQKNQDKIKKRSKEWCEKNRDRCLENARMNLNKRKKEDLLFKIKAKLKTDIYISLKRNKRNKRLDDILGMSIENFKIYIENQFESWMTWENWGIKTWHIDHKIPLSSANDEETLYKLWHYSNMRPLSAYENLKKGAKLNY